MEIRAVRFAQGVRCGKGSEEELFVDVDNKYNVGEYSLAHDDVTNMVTVTNHKHGKTAIVFPTNIAYIYPRNEVATTDGAKNTTRVSKKN